MKISPAYITVGLIAIIGLVYILGKRKYIPSPIILKLKYKLALVNPKFANYDIREGNSSYTENKSTIYICTKDPKTKQYYSDNTLIYVCLHECAHVLSQDYGHHEEFNRILKQLIEKAENAGIYNSSIPVPKTYCGLQN